MADAYVVVGNAVLIIAKRNCLCLAALSFLASCPSRIVQVYRTYFQWTFEFSFLRSLIYHSGSVEGLCVEIVAISHWHFSGPYTSQLIKSVYLNVKLMTVQH